MIVCNGHYEVPYIPPTTPGVNTFINYYRDRDRDRDRYGYRYIEQEEEEEEEKQERVEQMEEQGIFILSISTCIYFIYVCMSVYLYIW